MLVTSPPVDLDLPAVSSSVRVARRAVARLADSCGVDAQRVALCVSEAVTNAIVHAYRERPPGDILVRAQPDEDGAGLRVDVADHGLGMAPRPDSPGLGLGLPVIASLAARFEIGDEGSGCRISMWFDR